MGSEFDTYLQELRRGTVVLACLHLLRTAGYGYGLLAELEHRGFVTDANTLYPLLRRLEKQGYLTSEWNTDGARPRKFYRTSAAGIRLAEALTREWHVLTGAVDTLVDDGAGNGDGDHRATSPGNGDAAHTTTPDTRPEQED